MSSPSKSIRGLLSFRDRGMIDELNQQSVRIVKIKGPRAVSMGLRLLRQGNAVFPDSVSPGVYIVRMANHKTNVMHHLHGTCFTSGRQLMERQVVLSGRQIS